MIKNNKTANGFDSGLIYTLKSNLEANMIAVNELMSSALKQ